MSNQLRIGELAECAGVSVDAIRFYEKRGLLPKASRSSGGFRVYTREDILRIEFIRQMQGLGFSLQEIKQLAELRSHNAEACEAVRELLQEKLRQVRAKVAELQKLESELISDLHKCDKELKQRMRHAASKCPVLKEVARSENRASVRSRLS